MKDVSSLTCKLNNHVRAFPWGNHHTLGTQQKCLCVLPILLQRIFKKCIYLGSHLVKLIIFTALSKPFLNGTGICSLQVCGREFNVWRHCLNSSELPVILTTICFCTIIADASKVEKVNNACYCESNVDLDTFLWHSNGVNDVVLVLKITR